MKFFKYILNLIVNLCVYLVIAVFLNAILYRLTFKICGQELEPFMLIELVYVVAICRLTFIIVKLINKEYNKL